MTTNDMERIALAADGMDFTADLDSRGGMSGSARVDAATATLLRAVASEGNPVWTRTIWTAAVALADSILGASDE